MLHTILSILALVVSCGALTVSFLAYRQSKSVGLLTMRREAIAQVRAAIDDVVLHGNIRAETVGDIRDALQLTSLMFSSKVNNTLAEAFGIAFRLANKSEDGHSDQDLTDKGRLGDRLREVLKVMVDETKLSS